MTPGIEQEQVASTARAKGAGAGSGSGSDTLINAHCQACGHHVAVRFLDEHSQPLATVAWPSSSAEARAMKKLPLAFVRCVSCGHVYNAKFRYDEVPYSQRPNLMFNQGAGWSEHLMQVCNLLLKYLCEEPVVVEIGCGDGHLLRQLAEQRPRGRFIGFDPHGAIDTDHKFEARHELFIPAQHVGELRPNLLISRHVLEHLIDPLGFLQATGFATSWAGIQSLVFIEVPCIDRVLETGRTVDFYYEHNSHFTTESFSRMLQQAAGGVELLQHSYNREVVSGIIRLGGEDALLTHANQARRFREHAQRAKSVVGRQLTELAARGKRVAIWGGTGKAAAFMNYFGVDARRFPIVVDSDPKKVGTFVPGQGQQIRSPDYLLEDSVDVIMIPMQWRAADVIVEMREHDIRCEQILIEHQGRLIDFFSGDHPYRDGDSRSVDTSPLANGHARMAAANSDQCRARAAG